MAKCTAPINGHRTASGRANCPACGGRYSGYNSYSYNRPYSSLAGNSSNSNSHQTKTTARWSPAGSSLLYTPTQIRTLEPVRKNVEKRSSIPELKDIFLCHAWDDRKDLAKKLNDLLESKGVTVWFSENAVPLGSNLLREIDKGLATSRIGIVLVTPSFLKRINGEGISEKELSALLYRDLLIPIVYDTTFEELREISPLLGSRSGLNASEESLEDIVGKIAELVTV